jgi:hypothetical protein
VTDDKEVTNDKEATKDEDITGQDGYLGWMKVKLPSVFALYEAAIDAEVQNMRSVYPRTTEWFSRDKVWLDDDNWLDDDDEGGDCDLYKHQ